MLNAKRHRNDVVLFVLNESNIYMSQEIFNILEAPTMTDPKYDELMDKHRHDALMRLVASNDHTKLSDEELKAQYKEAKNAQEFYKMMQITTKLLCNSVYGGFGTASLRYFLQVVASDITAEGRNVCKLVDKMANKYFAMRWPNDVEWFNMLKNEFPDLIAESLKAPKPITEDCVVYCDTDSNYLTWDMIFETLDIDYRNIPTKRAVEFIEFFFSKRMNAMYDKFLDQYYQKRACKNHHIFELEVVGGYGIFVAKKKYIFSKLWEDGNYVAKKGGLKTTGIEIIQSSTSEFVRASIKTFVNMIFSKRGEISSSLFFNMCSALRRKLEDVPIDDIAKIGGLNTYDKYVVEWKDRIVLEKKCPAAVRGAARYNHLLYQNNLQNKYAYLKNGMKCKLYYDKQGNPFAYHDETFPVEIAPEVSRDIQLEKLIFAPVKRLVGGGMIEGSLNRMGSNKNLESFASMFKKKT